MGQAHAHRFHAALTDISFNARSESLEVVHTLMAHDLEQLMLNLYQREVDWSQPEDEALLRRYLEPRFALLGRDGKALPLRWLGIQVDTEALRVYLELPGARLEQIASVRNAILTDFLADQVNTVNLGSGAAVRSLTFTRQSPTLPLP
ncbi:DUF6702 family protein [Massilia sp. TS11]|uniref:DUF6702 family protein n=1 Tax=Massilia sp. TS11 TaxID=2908003 RepID=UPI001EDAF8D8|nr:hypothetical protein [Massilia sp. TS11]